MAQRRRRPALQPLGHPEVGLAFVFVVHLADLFVALSCVKTANVPLRMELDEAGAGLARGALARAHQLPGKPATTHGGHHGNASHDVGLALLHARIKRACRRLGHAGIQRALKLLGKHACAPCKLLPNIKNHMDARGVLINGLELILVTLLFHEDRTTNRKRVIVHLRRTRPAAHFDGGFHGTPFACDGCRHHTTIEQCAQGSSARPGCEARCPTPDGGAWRRVC